MIIYQTTEPVQIIQKIITNLTLQEEETLLN